MNVQKMAITLGVVATIGTGCNRRLDARQAEQAPDGSYVSLSGTVVTASYEQFQLDYGDGTLLVEMDDWQPDDDAVGLLPDDRVVVYGYIDDGFFEQRTLEASSVYVQSLGTWFYANGTDEEQLATATIIAVEPRITLLGDVAEVSPASFQLDTGTGTIRVDTSDLPYDPLDDDGYLQIDTGDRVQVGGRLESSFFDDLQLEASSLTELRG